MAAQEFFEEKRRARQLGAATKHGCLRLSEQEQFVTLTPEGGYLFSEFFTNPPTGKMILQEGGCRPPPRSLKEGKRGPSFSGYFEEKDIVEMVKRKASEGVVPWEDCDLDGM